MTTEIIDKNGNTQIIEKNNALFGVDDGRLIRADHAIVNIYDDGSYPDGEKTEVMVDHPNGKSESVILDGSGYVSGKDLGLSRVSEIRRVEKKK